MSDLVFESPDTLNMDGVIIGIDDGTGANLDLDKSDDRFYMFKTVPFLEAYAEIKKQNRLKDILEIGVYRGGSTVFFDRFFEPDTLVAVEYERERLPKLDRYIRNQAKSNVTVYTGVDQKSAPHLNAIVKKHFPNGLDLVVDDASHWYDETKSSFETLFPYVRTGGWFLIEDWSWAHAGGLQEPGNIWEDKPALTNLVFEIVVAHATNDTLIDKIIFSPGLVYLRRGSHPILPGQFRLADFKLMRGKSLSAI